MNSLFHALLEQVERLEAENGEDDGTGVDGGEGVGGGDDQHVPHAVLLWVVVGAETDDGTEGKTKGVENLNIEGVHCFVIWMETVGGPGWRRQARPAAPAVSPSSV